MSKGAEAQVTGSRQSDLQQLQALRHPREQELGLDRSDEAWRQNTVDIQGNAAELLSAFDALSDKNADVLFCRGRSAKLHDNHSSRPDEWMEAGSDPVAAFADYCESLAM